MPQIIVWENVPGALSSSHGEDLRCLLASLDELGYGLAWRVLDSQFFGVAQKRRRLFLVGCFGEPERATKILFEPESMSWSRATGSKGREAAVSAYRESTAKPDTAAYSVVLGHTGAIGCGYKRECSHTLDCASPNAVAYTYSGNYAIRKPMPIEYERLQGFPDNWTRISWCNKPPQECPDGPRYKAIGNSMAVPVMRWIGTQINKTII